LTDIPTLHCAINDAVAKCRYQKAIYRADVCRRLAAYDVAIAYAQEAYAACFVTRGKEQQLRLSQRDAEIASKLYLASETLSEARRIKTDGGGEHWASLEEKYKVKYPPVRLQLPPLQFDAFRRYNVHVGPDL
jgi:hypothetical protein